MRGLGQDQCGEPAEDPVGLEWVELRGCVSSQSSLERVCLKMLR